jgi:hypothetical protein
MSVPLPQNILLYAGADALDRFGTLVARRAPPTRGGELLQETFTGGAGRTMFSAQGTIIKANANIPRIEWLIDPVTGLLRKYLKLEPAATNYALQSQAWATGWTTGDLTATNNAATAPDGTTTATGLVPDTTGGVNHYINDVSVTITAGEYVALSCFIKANGYTGFRLSACDTTAQVNAFIANFDLAAGTLLNSSTSGTATYSGGLIVPLANGWFWVAIWGKIGGTATTAVPLGIFFDTGAHAQSGAQFAGDGTHGFYGWGMQLERNGTSNALPPTSYIATTTTAITRAAESFTVPAYTPAQGGSWLYVRMLDRGAFVPLNANVATLGNALPRLNIIGQGVGNSYSGAYLDAVGTSQSFGGIVPAVGSIVEVFLTLTATGAAQVSSALNGGSATVGNLATGAGAPGATWNVAQLIVGGGAGPLLISRVLAGVGYGAAGGIASLTDVRAIP